ncbi:MAG: toprim domain-containing protein [Legionellaceae bacterium]|nr:toprim domain-containing protein [Legionellaceae bacterium]
MASVKNGGFTLSNGAIKSHFIPIQIRSSDKKILICEGFATGATLAKKYSDVSVIAACNAGNLKDVAMNIRSRLPTAEIVICADDDRLNPDNPGINKGRIAAIAAGALFAKPKWPEGSPTHLKDYNDLDCWLNDQEIYHA